MARPITIRERLEQEALRLFAEKGVGNTSVRDIAEAADISQGALYRHYRGKDDLVTGLFVERYGALADDLDDIRTEQRELRPRLQAMVRTFCQLFDRDVYLFRFLLLVQHGQLALLPPDLRTPVDVVEDVVTEAVAAGELGPGNASLRAAVIMGIVLQAATFHIYGRLSGGLAPVAPDLAEACIAAVRATDAGEA